MIVNMQEKYDMLATEYSIPAREYFMILKLAIYHTDRKEMKSSYEVTKYKMNDKILNAACDILKSLYK